MPKLEKNKKKRQIRKKMHKTHKNKKKKTSWKRKKDEGKWSNTEKKKNVARPKEVFGHENTTNQTRRPELDEEWLSANQTAKEVNVDQSKIKERPGVGREEAGLSLEGGPGIDVKKGL